MRSRSGALQAALLATAVLLGGQGCGRNATKPVYQGTPAPEASNVVFVRQELGDKDLALAYGAAFGDWTVGASLTYNAAEHLHPTWSPDGSQIAYVSRRARMTGELCVLDLNQRVERRFAVDGAQCADPAWSPDGSQIVYVTGYTGERSAGTILQTISPSTSGVRTISIRTTASDPSWSPDGTKIVVGEGLHFCAFDWCTDLDGLSIVDVATSEGRPIPNGSGKDFDPVWSPVGNRIAFRRMLGGNAEILVVNEDGTNVINLTNNPAYDGSPTWSPDGTRIAFISDRGGNPDLYAMAADGSDVHRVTNTSGAESDPEWSPTGARIAYALASQGRVDVCAVSPDGSGFEALTPFQADDIDPAWSPPRAMTALVFASNRYGDFELFRYDSPYHLTFDTLTRLTESPGDDVEPAVSKDGARIAFASARAGNFDIYAMQSDGQGVVRLTDDPAADREPSWSPATSAIAFSSERDGNAEVYVMNSSGADVSRLTLNPGQDRSPAWSPDGSKIAFTSDRFGNMDVFVMNGDGTGLQRLTTANGDDTQPAWSTDGSRILFVSRRGGTPALYGMNADGSEQKMVHEAGEPPEDMPCWQPN